LRVIMVKSMIMNIVDFICFAWKFIWRKIFKLFGPLLIVNSKIVNYVFWFPKFLSIVSVSKVSPWSSFLLTSLISCLFTHDDKLYQGVNVKLFSIKWFGKFNKYRIALVVEIYCWHPIVFKHCMIKRWLLSITSYEFMSLFF
jgi:hypothetical protein